VTRAASVAALWLLSALAAGLASTEQTGPRHLIYLHGRIVQDQQSPRPRHPEFGHYELEQILAAFRKRGFVVTGGIRPKGEAPSASADPHATLVVRELLLDTGLRHGFLYRPLREWVEPAVEWAHER
jgi:hypothetical protein